jgi:hypothetical protein
MEIFHHGLEGAQHVTPLKAILQLHNFLHFLAIE